MLVEGVRLVCAMGEVVLVILRSLIQFCRVEELQTDYKEEEITQKGYVKRLLSLLNSHLMETDREDIAHLEKKLKDADITEVRVLPPLTLHTYNPHRYAMYTLYL